MRWVLKRKTANMKNTEERLGVGDEGQERMKTWPLLRSAGTLWSWLLIPACHVLALVAFQGLNDGWEQSVTRNLSQKAL